MNFRSTQQCLIFFHYEPPQLFSCPQNKTNKNQLQSRKGTAADQSGTCLLHSCHQLPIIPFLRRSHQHRTKYSPGKKPPAQRHSQTFPQRRAPQREQLSLCETDTRSGEALPTRDPAHCEILPFHKRVAIQSPAYT